MARRFHSLADYLEKTKTTQAELAARVGVKQSLISRIVNGTRRPSGDLAFRLEDVTGIPARELLQGQLSTESGAPADGVAS